MRSDGSCMGSLGPSRRWRGECDCLVIQRMPETDLPRVQTQRWIIYVQSLTLTQSAPGQIRGIPAHRVAQVREMNANLIRAAGERPGFEQGSAVTQSSLYVKLSTGGQSRLLINGS